MNILEVKNLSTYFFKRTGEPVKAVDGVNFNLKQGEILGIVGESGSGKSVTAKSILRLVKRPGKIVSGSVIFEGKDLLKIPDKEIRKVRGAKIAFISQNPIKSFNPPVSIGKQLEEMVALHRPEIKGKERKEFVIELLKKMEIADPYEKFTNIPDEWSGGMSQRAMIAKMALVPRPKIIIADEPTTALDATIGAQILHLLTNLVREQNISLILITHDLGIMARYVDRVVVMYRGKTIEEDSVSDLFKHPSHPYTKELLEIARVIPQRKESEVSTEKIAVIDDLKVYFPVFGGKLWQKRVSDIKAVDGISLTIRKGETLGLVGESGCGKTTLAKAILRLVEGKDRNGKIFFKGQDLDGIPEDRRKEVRRNIQAIFQDPTRSLSPKKTVEDIIGEGIDIHQLCGKDKIARRDRIIEIAQEVGISLSLLFRHRRELSDGQRQRVAIARAMVVLPELVILDEPISSLDKKSQKQVLELLLRLQKEFSLTYLFISHDLNVVKSISDRLAIMYLGKIVEEGVAEDVINHPLHPYTQALFSCQSILDPELARSRETIILRGEVPSSEHIPSGCRFHTRCPRCEPRCEREEPVFRDLGGGHLVACHRV